MARPTGKQKKKAKKRSAVARRSRGPAATGVSGKSGKLSRSSAGSRPAETISLGRLVAGLPFAEGFSESVLDDISGCGRIRRLRRGDVMFNEGTPATACYIVVTGILKSYTVSSSGRAKSMALLIEGDTWGEESIVETGVHDCTCQAIEDSTVLVLERHAVEKLVRRKGEVALAFLRAAGKRLRHARENISVLTLRAADARLARILLELSERRKKDGISSPFMKIPLSHQELADLIGLGREAVTRGLMRFRRANIIAIQGRTIALLDPAALGQLAMDT